MLDIFELIRKDIISVPERYIPTIRKTYLLGVAAAKQIDTAVEKNRGSRRETQRRLTLEEPRDDNAREYVRVLDHEGLPVLRPARQIHVFAVAGADHFECLAQKDGFLTATTAATRTGVAAGAAAVIRTTARLGSHGVTAAACGHRSTPCERPGCRVCVTG